MKNGEFLPVFLHGGITRTELSRVESELLVVAKAYESEAEKWHKRGQMQRAALLYENAADQIFELIKLKPKKEYTKKHRKLLGEAISNCDIEIMDMGQNSPDLYETMARCCEKLDDKMFAERHRATFERTTKLAQEKPSYRAYVEISILKRAIIEQIYEGEIKVALELVDRIIELAPLAAGQFKDNWVEWMNGSIREWLTNVFRPITGMPQQQKIRSKHIEWDTNTPTEVLSKKTTMEDVHIVVKKLDNLRMHVIEETSAASG